MAAVQRKVTAVRPVVGVSVTVVVVAVVRAVEAAVAKKDPKLEKEKWPP